MPNVTRCDSLLLLAAIGIGVGFRFYGLDTQSLWIDEIYSTRFALAPRLDAALFAEMLREPHPPLWTTFLQIWGNRVGVSEIALRVPPAVASALAIPAMYFLGRRVVGPERAAVATIIIAMSSFLVVYAQDARPYGFLTLFATLATLLWLEMLDDVRQRALSGAKTVLFIVLNVVLSYVHYFGFLLVGLLTAYLFGLALAKRRLVGITAGIGLASTIPFLLWFVPSIPHVSRLLGGIAGDNWMKETTGWDVPSLGRALFAQPSILILLLLPFVRLGMNGACAAEFWRHVRQERHFVPLVYAITAPLIRYLGSIRIVLLIYSVSLLTFVVAGYPVHKVPYYAPFREQFREATLHVVRLSRHGDIVGSIGHRWNDVAYFEWFRIYLDVLDRSQRLRAAVQTFPFEPSKQPAAAHTLFSMLSPGGSLFVIGGHGNFLAPEGYRILRDVSACHRVVSLINARVYEFHTDRTRCP